MGRTLLRIGVCCLLLHGSWMGVAWAQSTPPVAAQPAGAQAFSLEQIDALVAPIALYPDPLLTQVLMASTFPLQVVQTWRWVEDPAHKGLAGDALTNALETLPWDPSVKSLVPFPQVLSMMNADLDWTQQLGYAFADQQTEVMNSVQRLRRQAESNGNLKSSPQQVVRNEAQTIVIEPAEPNVVYVPSYQPTAVYGAWPYPSYPPVYLPPPPGYAFGTALATGLAFGTGIAITAGLWNWARPAWGAGQVNVNVNRYNSINVNRAQIRSNVWQPNRAGGRPAGLARPPAGPVGRPARMNGLPANAIGRQQVSVPRNTVRPGTRPAGAGAGRPATAQRRPAPSQRPTAGGRPTSTQRPTSSQRPTARQRPTSTQRPATGAASRRPAAASRPATPTRQTAFSGMNQGRSATQYGARGAQSRSFSQRSHAAPAGRGGGGVRGGGRRR